MNQQRIFAKIEKIPNWNRRKFLFVGALLNCQSIYKFIPQNEVRNPRDPYEVILGEIEKEESNRYLRSAEIYRLLTGATANPKHAEELRQIRKVFSFVDRKPHDQVLAKLNYAISAIDEYNLLAPNNWGMDFDPTESIDSFVPDSMGENFASMTSWLYERTKNDPSFEGFSNLFPMIAANDGPHSDCDRLAELSKEALTH